MDIITVPDERDAWKAYASDVAAAFTMEWIADGLPLPPSTQKVSLYIDPLNLSNKHLTDLFLPVHVEVVCPAVPFFPLVYLLLTIVDHLLHLTMLSMKDLS